MKEPLILRTGEREFRVEVDEGQVLVDGTPVKVPAHAVAAADGSTGWVFLDGEVYEFEVDKPGRAPQAPRRTSRATAHHGSLTSPMPATVRKIIVQPGAVVKKGDTLVVLEAMKMELPVRAPSNGVVSRISCREGELVQPGIVLVEIDAEQA